MTIIPCHPLSINWLIYQGVGHPLGAYLLSCFSHALLFMTPQTVAHQAPLSLGFSRQEYWSGLPFPPPGGLPNPGIESMSPAAPALQVDSLLLCYRGITLKRDVF